MKFKLFFKAWHKLVGTVWTRKEHYTLHKFCQNPISVNSWNSSQNPHYVAIWPGHNWHAHTCSHRAFTVACIGISHMQLIRQGMHAEHQMLREGSSYHSMILPDYGQLKEKECFSCGQCQIFLALFFSSSKSFTLGTQAVCMTSLALRPMSQMLRPKTAVVNLG